MANRKELRKYTQRIKQTIQDIRRWDYTKPDWTLFNAIRDDDLREIAGLYAPSASDYNRSFLTNVSVSRRKLTSKQKFRVLSTLSKF